MSAIPLLFVDRNQEWLDCVREALAGLYDVHTAVDIDRVGEPFPGGVFSLIFVVWYSSEKQRKQIATLNRTFKGKDRIIVILPRHEDSPDELRSIFLAGAYDIVNKPQTSRRIREMVSEVWEQKYKVKSDDEDVMNTNAGHLSHSGFSMRVAPKRA